jgi:hypothetical protein
MPWTTRGTVILVMPWLDHGIHSVTWRPGTGFRVDGWSGGLLLVRADREGTAWMP